VPGLAHAFVSIFKTGPSWLQAAGTFHAGLKWAFEAFNSSAGVNQRCQSGHEGAPYLCNFAEHVAPFIATPMFALQSQYDGWQLGSVLANGSDPEAVAEMGLNITGRLNASVLAPHPSNGGFLDSCGELSHVLPTECQASFDGVSDLSDSRCFGSASHVLRL